MHFSPPFKQKEFGSSQRALALRVTVTTSLSVCNLELQIHIKSRRGIKNDVVASPSFIVKGYKGVTPSLMRSAETNNKKKFNEDLVPYPASGFSVLKGGD